jgi:hypothetical protein
MAAARHRFAFLGADGTAADPQLSADVARSGGFSVEQIRLLTAAVLGCLQSSAVRPVPCRREPALTAVAAPLSHPPDPRVCTGV